jgi:hypothetical protein
MEFLGQLSSKFSNKVSRMASGDRNDANHALESIVLLSEDSAAKISNRTLRDTTFEILRLLQHNSCCVDKLSAVDFMTKSEVIAHYEQALARHDIPSQIVMEVNQSRWLLLFDSMSVLWFVQLLYASFHDCVDTRVISKFRVTQIRKDRILRRREMILNGVTVVLVTDHSQNGDESGHKFDSEEIPHTTKINDNVDNDDEQTIRLTYYQTTIAIGSGSLPSQFDLECHVSLVLAHSVQSLLI